eukprot:CAMPEP_0117690586 /NCGR_PEP_ID=MMETSP0804-20121206/25210_1 /TAXON_ID=1074897 /ORGANISM="Tetraselmis astigmatica, Strain CCMP880" /LENGTH=61 /DNA_ID=CAMNT_0005503651 /DNA_START=169 /DNA_END=354 /DNA_ORIENTATION=-
MAQPLVTAAVVVVLDAEAMLEAGASEPTGLLPSHLGVPIDVLHDRPLDHNSGTLHGHHTTH